MVGELTGAWDGLREAIKPLLTDSSPPEHPTPAETGKKSGSKANDIVPGAVELADDLAGKEVIGEIEAGGGKVLEGMSTHKLKEFLDSLIRTSAGGQAIEPRNSGFTLHDGRRESVLELSEVVAVTGSKVDKVTYEESYLILTKADDTRLSVGELADGFAEFETAIYESLADFPKQWRTTLEKAAPGEFVDLWAAKPRSP